MAELPVYLDNAATTPIDPRVAEGMIECLRPGGTFGNPSSSGHEFGHRARAVVEKARAQVASTVRAKSQEIVWTSGATEADNLAVMGVARFHADRGRHIVSAKTEHKAVLDALKQLEREGFSVTYLKPGPGGRIGAEQVSAAIRPETVLVSIMHVNNETGVVNDIAAIGAQCRSRDVLFHCDAAQSVGRVPVDVASMNVDLLSLNAHKVHGPKGIGALYVRSVPPVGLEPLMCGGGQERGLRSGTLPTHQIVGMGLAFELAQLEMHEDMTRLGELRDRLWEAVSSLGGVVLNGDAEHRVANILNVTFLGVEGESLQFALRRLAVSAGAACSSASEEASYVLRALGRSDQEAQSSLRFSLGRFTSAAEIDFAIGEIRREVPRLRQIARQA